MASESLLKALAVALEVTGTELSEAALRVIVGRLEGHPEPSVLRALDRCMSQCKGRLSLAEILERIPGRPVPLWRASDRELIERAGAVGVSTYGKSRQRLIGDIEAREDE